MRVFETLIIGGGIAGLACARRLHQAGKEFRLVTDRLGGRMFAGEGAMRNFGAMYVTDDYRHVGRFVERGTRLRRRDARFHDGRNSVAMWDKQILRQRGALLRLVAELFRLRRHLNRLRAACPTACQAKLLQDDPVLERWVKEPAAEFVKRNGLQSLNELSLDPVVNSTVFASADQVNTFYYLAAQFPLVVPTFLADFSKTLVRLADEFRRQILLERVIALGPAPDGDYTVSTTAYDLRAKTVVIATPAHNSRVFCPDLDPREEARPREIPIVTLHVRGRRRSSYAPGKIVYLQTTEVATVLLPIGPGLDMIFSRTPDPDLSPYYEAYEIIAQVHWKTAVQLSLGRWRPLAPRPTLYTIGDYNICGLEDSYLTGIYAANQIIG
jgi:glycine/D-amino acid oxidase-like deaminating enzyme